MSRSTMEWAMEQEEIAFKRKLRDQAALAALPAIIRVCAGDTPREIGTETFEQMFARKAWMIADEFVEARDTPEEEIK